MNTTSDHLRNLADPVHNSLNARKPQKAEPFPILSVSIGVHPWLNWLRLKGMITETTESTHPQQTKSPRAYRDQVPDLAVEDPTQPQFVQP
jgi:hypothetical protein